MTPAFAAWLVACLCGRRARIVPDEEEIAHRLRRMLLDLELTGHYYSRDYVSAADADLVFARAVPGGYRVLLGDEVASAGTEQELLQRVRTYWRARGV